MVNAYCFVINFIPQPLDSLHLLYTTQKHTFFPIQLYVCLLLPKIFAKNN